MKTAEFSSLLLALATVFASATGARAETVPPTQQLTLLDSGTKLNIVAPIAFPAGGDTFIIQRGHVYRADVTSYEIAPLYQDADEGPFKAHMFYNSEDFCVARTRQPVTQTTTFAANPSRPIVFDSGVTLKGSQAWPVGGSDGNTINPQGRRISIETAGDPFLASLECSHMHSGLIFQTLAPHEMTAADLTNVFGGSISIDDPLYHQKFARFETHDPRIADGLDSVMKPSASALSDELPRSTKPSGLRAI